MPSAARHAKPTPPAIRRRAPLAAAATLTGVAAAFVFLQSGSAAPRPPRDTIAMTGAASGLTGSEVTTAVVRDITAAKADMEARQAARRRHIAQRRAARRHAAQQAAAQPPPPPPSAAPAPPSSGGDAAHSPLGICIRNAEEGGSYAWGPGNGGGAYQFALSTWEAYGGAASEFGVAGPAYQDQIFDNAIAAGGASNWTNYDGC
jgi:hypothetical protein